MYFDQLGRAVKPGQMLMASIPRGKWDVVGYLEQDGRIILRLRPNPTLSIFDKKGFAALHLYIIPEPFSQFQTRAGDCIKVGDYLFKDGMEAEVLQSLPNKDELLVRCRYTHPDAPVRGWWASPTTLTYLDILHADWKIRKFAKYEFKHNPDCVKVEVCKLLPGDFFMLRGELYQIKSRHECGWMNCHNLDKATHPSIDFLTAVTPVRVHIETYDYPTSV